MASLFNAIWNFCEASCVLKILLGMDIILVAFSHLNIVSIISYKKLSEAIIIVVKIAEVYIKWNIYGEMFVEPIVLNLVLNC